MARHLAAALTPHGWDVIGTSRTPAEGVWRFGWDAPLPDAAWEGVTHIVHSIPPDERGDIVWEQWRKRMPLLSWVGYLSSTSVYGDTSGAWVDEEAACLPPTPRGQRRLTAERNWLRLWEEVQAPVHIFRLSGIYGPGRNALTDMLNGTARRIYKEGQVFSRIHVEDIVRTLLGSMRVPCPGEIYNVADNLPAPAWEVVEYAAHLLGVMPPPMIPFEQAELSPMARSFYEASRRVSNRKIKESLGVALRFPDYRKGLEHLLEQEKARALHG